MNRKIQLFAGLFAILGFAHIAYAAGFSDTVGTPYDTAFTYLKSKGVIQGYATGEGKPNSALNRAEALKVIAGLRVPDRVDWYKQNVMPLPLFYDVPSGEWYTPYVEAGFESNILTGYPDRTFRPANNLKFEEAVVMVLRAYGLEGVAGGAQLSPYMQNRDGEWFTPYINDAIAKNLIMHQGRMELGQIITRGRFFDLVYRLDKIQSESAVAYSGPEPQGPIAPQQRVNVPQRVNPQVRVISSGQSSITALPEHSSEKHFAVSIPSLGIKDLTVTHPADPFTPDGILQPLQHGLGHLFSYPGAGGKIMIYGHSSSYHWDVSKFTKIFRTVNTLEVGSRIFVTYDGKLHTYEVTRHQTIQASDTTPFQDQGGGEELILYTCWPRDSIAQRYLIHALPVSSVALR
ncbi:MAG: sortase [Candidatus Peribacteraceae bacterium]|jgi:LPXTG-site transpeptidase (sortase) family protein|nr:sortase [Candidatus Peribacteraceae bacterium]|tara:strand:- start:8745 stop:9953 length:1209 start_codon:yes stop_codon:yes gene_type:complete